MTVTPTTRETWTYAADAVYTPRSIFRNPAAAPLASDSAQPQQPDSAQKPAPAYTPTPERYMTESEFIELRTVILTALLPYPEARNAIATALATALEQENAPGVRPN
ncbi:MAG: hypothetical protein R2762_30000 [Bryobacteraceae bacterium]